MSSDVLAARPVGSSISLRWQGVFALIVLVIYVASSAWLLERERRALGFIGQQLNSHRVLQEALAPTFNTLAHTLVQTQGVLSKPNFSPDTHASYGHIAVSLDPLVARLQNLRQMGPKLASDVDRLTMAVESVRQVPSGRNLAQVRDAEQALIADFDDLLTTIQHRADVLAKQYHAQQQRISLIAIAASVGGALATAAIILTFFTRLARDLQRLQSRAAAIVSGYSGPPLKNGRRDEVGGLIDAVNRMQSDLRHWEQQQELGRQQRFHQEKMAAVGSMAAAIGHEVSNPIAAIAGVAQYLIEETRGDTQRTGQLAHDFSVQILRQTERISLIMRQLATLSRQQSPEPELLDLNALVQSTGSFIAFDKRFRGIEFEYRLDHEMPAVTAVADHLTQVLMNLLINAADAMEETPKHGAARIEVATAPCESGVRLDVADTGQGMTAEVMARAFEESFTTKPAGRGRGIGLFLCKTLMEQAGGRIELESQPGAGTTVRVFLPLVAPDGAGG